MDTNAGNTHVTTSAPGVGLGSTAPAGLARPTGTIAVVGAVVMIVGAALYFSGGAATDLPVALDDGTIGAYLDAVAGNAAVVANLSLWILGATLMGSAAAGFALLGRSRPGLAVIAAATGLLGAATAIGAFVAWLSVVVVVAPTGDALLGETLGWFAWHMDAVATALIVGFAPLLNGLAGRDSWAPRWLVVWGLAAGLFGVVSLVGVYLPALADVGFLIVPAGIGWMIAAGVVALRHPTHAPSN